MPDAVVKTANCGSCRCGKAVGVRRGAMTWTAVISSSSSQRLTSTSWIIESVIVMKLVNDSGTLALRWTLWSIKGSPMVPLASVALTCR